MDKYIFEGDQFGVSKKGIHFLKSRYNYETFNFSDIKELKIYKGKEIKNWILLLSTGIVFLITSLSYEYTILKEHVFGNSGERIYMEQFSIPIVFILIGIYCIVHSLKNGLIMEIITDSSSRQVVLDKSNEDYELDQLIDFIKEKIKDNDVKISYPEQ